jgi:hypothetical protein
MHATNFGRARVRIGRPPIVTIAIGSAIVLASCGGSGSTGYHNPKYPYGAPNVPFSMSKCMHANGVPDFPDPRAGPEGSSGGVGWPGGGPFMISPDVLVVMGQRLGGPAVAAAAKVCKEYMAPSGPPPALSESQRVAALDFAACMRTHGLNFPDPTFSGGNQQINLGPGLNPDSPAVIAASKTCRAPRP